MTRYPEIMEKVAKDRDGGVNVTKGLGYGAAGGIAGLIAGSIAGGLAARTAVGKRLARNYLARNLKGKNRHSEPYKAYRKARQVLEGLGSDGRKIWRDNVAVGAGQHFGSRVGGIAGLTSGALYGGTRDRK